jgi:hypothetical protein
MQDNRNQVWGRRADDQTASRKTEKAQNKQIARRTSAEPSLATSRPSLGLFPELLNFYNLLSVSNLYKDALLKCPDNLKDKFSHVYALRNIYCFWDDQNKVRIMRTIFVLSCLWRVL